MASSLDVLTLRSRVATALSGSIGTYEYESGATQAALVISNGLQKTDSSGYPIPQPKKCIGLEVVIEPYTRGRIQSFIGDGSAFYDEYRIWLKQHDITKSVQTAFTTLFTALQDIVTGHIDAIPRNTALDSLEQAALLIQYRRI